jgi:hypothetical protein
MNFQDINELANDTLPYEGDDYTGYGDDFLNFGGGGKAAMSFANEIASKNTFSIVVINNTGLAQNVYLFASYATKLTAVANGTLLLKDGVITGLPGATLNASGTPKTIANFLAFLDINPTNIVGFKVSSNVADMVAAKMTIENQCPYKNLENHFIDFASYTSEINNNDKMVTINEPFQVDSQTDVYLNITDQSRTTFTFYIGASLNTAHALKAKSGRAGRSPMVQNVKALTGVSKGR